MDFTEDHIDHHEEELFERLKRSLTSSGRKFLFRISVILKVGALPDLTRKNLLLGSKRKKLYCEWRRYGYSYLSKIQQGMHHEEPKFHEVNTSKLDHKQVISGSLLNDVLSIKLRSQRKYIKKDHNLAKFN